MSSCYTPAGLSEKIASLIGSLLYGVKASDPLTYTGVALLLVVVALLACLLAAGAARGSGRPADCAARRIERPSPTVPQRVDPLAHCLRLFTMILRQFIEKPNPPTYLALRWGVFICESGNFARDAP